MRLATLASATILALSTAALAQVGTSPEEQKLPIGNDAVAPDETARATPTPTATETPEPGMPSTALVKSAGTDDGGEAGSQPPK